MMQGVIRGEQAFPADELVSGEAAVEKRRRFF